MRKAGEKSACTAGAGVGRHGRCQQHRGQRRRDHRAPDQHHHPEAVAAKCRLLYHPSHGMRGSSREHNKSAGGNRVVNYHMYVPSPKMKFVGLDDFLKKYQARAPAAGTDLLGFYQPPFAYAALQVLEQAINATKSFDDGKLSDYIHANAFDTVVGKIRFNELGEWAKPGVLMIQFQNIQGSGLDQYQQPGKQVILYPPEYRDGELISPFAK